MKKLTLAQMAALLRAAEDHLRRGENGSLARAADKLRAGIQFAKEADREEKP